MKHRLEKWVRKMGIPEDVLLDIPILEMQEFTSIHIVNYIGISELTEEKIRVTVKSGEYVIEGMRLSISKAANREILIQGDIKGLSFHHNTV